MTTQEAIDHFGTVKAVAEAIGIQGPAVSQWGEYPPLGRQFQLELATKGKLKAERAKSQRA